MEEEKYLFKCSRCFVPHDQIPITSLDSDGNLYCIKCSNYLRKIGGYDLIPFRPSEFLDKNKEY